MEKNRQIRRESWPKGLRQKSVRGVDRFFFLDTEGKAHYFPKGTLEKTAIDSVIQMAGGKKNGKK